MQTAGVKVSSLGSPIGKIDIQDEPAFQRQLAQLESLCGICKLLDCRYIRVFSFFIPPEQDPEAFRDRVLEKLAQFESAARQHGIILLHENEKGIYGDTAGRCLTLLRSIGSPYLRAAFDYANFVQCGQDTVQAWQLLHSYVTYIHVKDALASGGENVVCGTGDGQIEPLLRRAIRQDGYQGFLTLEPHLALFDSFKTLEQQTSSGGLSISKAKDGAEGYRLQYEALQAILTRI